MTRPLVPLDISHFLHNPGPAWSHSHAASIWSTGERLFATWYAYPEQEHKDAVIAFNEYDAAHDSWGRSRRLFDTLDSSLGNPVLVGDGDALFVFFVILENGAYWDEAEVVSSRSDDGGASWTRPTPLGLAPGTMLRHPPCRVDAGWVLPAYDESRREVVLLRAANLADPWTVDCRLADSYIQPDLVPLDSGAVQLYCRPTDHPAIIARCYSANGRLWSSPLATGLDCPLSGLAACRSGNTVIVSHNATTEHKRSPLSLSLSTDEGMTFPLTADIETADLELSYPSMTIHDGHVHVLYTHARRRIKHVAVPIKVLDALK